MSLTVIFLAAGASSRMKSPLPKAMMEIANQPLIEYCFQAIKLLPVTNIVLVTNPQQELLRKSYPNVLHAIQQQPLGTGDAIKSALPLLTTDYSIVIYADTPFLSSETLGKIYQKILADNNQSMVVVGFECNPPNNYGKLVLDQHNHLTKIVENTEASASEKNIVLANGGITAFNNKHLPKILDKLHNHNSKKEYYLFDLVEISYQQGLSCSYILGSEEEIQGINTPADLAFAEKTTQQRLRKKFLDHGVRMVDPESVYFSFDTKIASDVLIEPHVWFGPKVQIDSHVKIRAFSYIEGAHIQQGSIVGPYARIRPQTVIAANAKIGNFVEIKNSTIGSNSKVSHLSYIGDSSIGNNCNIGAGAITCNYDGYAYKYQTVIGENVSIGSNASLIAPLKIEDDSIIAAGSVINQNVPKDSIAISRTEQKNLLGKANQLRNKKKKND